jgi:hypothetical protein
MPSQCCEGIFYDCLWQFLWQFCPRVGELVPISLILLVSFLDVLLKKSGLREVLVHRAYR